MNYIKLQCDMVKASGKPNHDQVFMWEKKDDNYYICSDKHTVVTVMPVVYSVLDFDKLGFRQFNLSSLFDYCDGFEPECDGELKSKDKHILLKVGDSWYDYKKLLAFDEYPSRLYFEQRLCDKTEYRRLYIYNSNGDTLGVVMPVKAGD